MDQRCGCGVFTNINIGGNVENSTLTTSTQGNFETTIDYARAEELFYTTHQQLPSLNLSDEDKAELSDIITTGIEAAKAKHRPTTIKTCFQAILSFLGNLGSAVAVTVLAQQIATFLATL